MLETRLSAKAIASEGNSKPVFASRLETCYGYITPAVLVTLVVTSIVLYALANLVVTQYQLLQRQTANEKALAIAEAGINYYKWHLAHDDDDFQDGTGQPGPYLHDYVDPQGGADGQFSLEITPPEIGSTIVTITATGWTQDYPDVKRTITVQYGQPSMAQYVFLHDSSIWLGDGLEIYGKVHSNGGIRQDGVNHSLITSALDTYTCGSETGCSPSQTKPAVWGDGGDAGLWDFPQTPVDFDSVSVDFATMREAAQTEGLYLGESGTWGYRLIFNPNGTVDVYRVTQTYNRRGYDNGSCYNLYQGIQQQVNIGTYTQSDLPIIFAEDQLWVEGTVTSSVNIVAARFPLNSNTQDIWVNNSLKYAVIDGSIRAGLIAQNDIIFARDIDQNFEIDAALLAQGGRIMRHHYNVYWCSSSSNAVRDSLHIFGAVISAEKSYWNWGSAPSSGFRTRDVSYDAHLLYNPPPYFPTTGEYELISWTE